MKTLITFSCILCYAVSALAQSKGDYRSINSGKWSDFANVWQKYDGSKWLKATTYPTGSDGIITIKDTTDVTVDIDITINQTVVEAGGVLSLFYSRTLTLSGSGDALTINGLLDFPYGTIAGTANLKIAGNMLWSGGDLQAALINKGTINISSNVSLFSSLTNNATINWYSDYIYFQSGSILNNSIFNVLSNGTLNNSSGTFTNNANGIFNQANGNNSMNSEVTFNNKGLINLNTGAFIVYSGTFTNTKEINFNGGSFTNRATSNFNTGTIITGSGRITALYNTLNINTILSLPAAVTAYIGGSGTIAGSGNLKINGVMNWNAGAVNIPLNILSAGTLNISYDNVDLYSTITNNGTVNWASGYLSFHNGTIVNNKNFYTYGNGYLNNAGTGTFTNNAGANFVKQVGAGNVTNRITFNNAGTINLVNGEFDNDGGTFTNTGLINFSGGNFENNTTANFNAGTSLTGSGAIIATNNTFNINTAITLPSTISFYMNYGGATVTGSGSLKISGNMFWYDGELFLPLTILNTGTLYIGTADAGLHSTLTNNGIVNWVNGYIYFSGGSIVNNKTFNISCDQNLYKYTSGTFTNSKTGTVTKTSQGTTTVSIPFTNTGTVKGTGTYNFSSNLTNNGTFKPGINNATGILATGTDYKNKTLAIRMNDSLSGLGYDRLIVNGNITIGGNDTLKVTASDSMPPGAYIILSCTGIRSGTFKFKQLPAGYTVTYKSNKVMVNVPSGFANKNISDGDESNAIEKSAVDVKSLSVFPNPAINILNYSFKGLKNKADAVILNSKGEIVKKYELFSGENGRLNISGLAAGSYVFQVSDNAKTYSARFIKQ